MPVITRESMLVLTKEEIATLSAAPKTPLFDALSKLAMETRNKINQAKLDLMGLLERLNEEDDGEGPIFPPPVLTQVDEIRDMLGAYSVNLQIACKFAIDAPYDIAVLQIGAHGSDVVPVLPRGYCDYSIVTNSTKEEDVVRIPIYVRDVLVDAYAQRSDIVGKTIAQWLETMPYAFHRDYGIGTMRELGIIK